MAPIIFCFILGERREARWRALISRLPLRGGGTQLFTRPHRIGCENNSHRNITMTLSLKQRRSSLWYGEPMKLEVFRSCVLSPLCVAWKTRKLDEFSCLAPGFGLLFRGSLVKSLYLVITKSYLLLLILAITCTIYSINRSHGLVKIIENWKSLDLRVEN